MQSPTNQSKQSPSPGLKQFKVDNWSSYFLQRLQVLYSEDELLDLTIKFPTSEFTIQAHRLVVTTCTDYFVQLERMQKKIENFNGILMMPPDMPYECVKAIISFMYTGQLEYWTSEQTALYKTAEKMNMTVLTKLLDAQSSTPVTQSSLSSPPPSSSSPSSTVNEEKQMSLGQQSLNSYKKTNQELPLTPLPGRKLPIWRRKIDTPSSSTSTSSPSSSMNNSLNYGKRKYQSTSGPSRFELPDVDDMTLGVFSSFDDITYNTKPIVKAEKNNRDDDSNNHTSYNRSLNIDTSKNDTTEDEDDDMKTIKQWDNDNNSDDDWSGPKGILRDPVDGQQTPSKRVRFELEEKENLEKQEKNTNDSMNNHAKIVREVLKKYPHLVKNHQNIRLKIMQKDNKSNDTNTPSKTKVSYVVLKSDHLMGDNNDDTQINKTQTSENGENGIWKCPKCDDISQEYTKYYMYRRHMQDVHDEKFDPRICEQCGYKATKRNILMYHMYTKHNIQPPKNMSFPKCHACNYVALSDTLLARHQISQNHRQTSKTSRDQIQCVDCPLKFTDINDLASHEISSGHGKVTNSKEHRGYRCSKCSKCFVRPVNLQTHIETMHKNTNDNEDLELPIFRTTLEPSSEAEALSTVASGIAASLGVDNNDDVVNNTIIIDNNQQQPQIVATSDGDYLVPEIDINQLTQEANFNGQMIYLIDDNTYQQQQVQQLQLQHQQPQQLELSSNEQIVMQGTDDGMLVYIAGNDDNNQQQNDNQIYQTYEIEQNDNQITEEEEEIFEEEVVEEVEEVVEEIVEEINDTIDNNSQQHDDDDDDDNGGNIDENIEREIQYVEETEIVEYDDEQVNNEQNQNEQDSTTIIEEEQIDNQDDKTTEETSAFAAEWDESSEEVHQS